MPGVVAVGFFDGVHLGHAALLRRTVEEAAARGVTPAIFTFAHVVLGELVQKLEIPSAVQWNGPLPHGVSAHSRTDGEHIYLFRCERIHAPSRKNDFQIF